VLAIETGTTVDFPNYDPIFHNAFSNFSGQLFDIGLYAPGSSRSFRFQRSGTVRIFCNIHPAMSAVILVVDTPYFAVSRVRWSVRDRRRDAGRVSTQGLSRARRRKRAARPGAQGAGGAGKLDAAEDGDIGKRLLAGASHKNKYGKDYPKTVEDGAMYPGAPN
jgi:hypothetical protein